MAGLTKFLCVFPLRSGLAQIECWGNSPDSEIVVHPFLGLMQGDSKSEFDGRWVLTHKRTGKNINAPTFPSIETALVVAAELDKIEDFKKIRVERLTEGPLNDPAFMSSLRDQVSTRLAEFASRTSEQPGAVGDQSCNPTRTA